MSNYTKPNDPNHNDSAQDWLNSALLFARTLGFILKDTEGIVIDVKGDMNFDHLGDGEKIKRVIVFKDGESIKVMKPNNIEEIQEVEEGTLLWVHDPSMLN